MTNGRKGLTEGADNGVGPEAAFVKNERRNTEILVPDGNFPNAALEGREEKKLFWDLFSQFFVPGKSEDLSFSLLGIMIRLSRMQIRPIRDREDCFHLKRVQVAAFFLPRQK